MMLMQRSRPTASRLGRIGSALAAAVLVAAGCANVDEQPDVEGAASGPVNSERFNDVNELVGNILVESGISGAAFVIFDRENGIVSQEYWGEFAADRPSLLASGSKMITAGVLSRLADQGLIDLDLPISNYVDWAEDTNITAAQLVSNSSGLVGLGPEPTYSPYLCQFIGSDLRDCGETIITTPLDDADVVPPDTDFRYGGAQWQVAGAVAESVSGKSWEELIHETYIEPCGVESLGYTNQWAQSGMEYPRAFDPASLTPTANPSMEGGAYITAPDYTELLLMHLRGGECPNGRVLSPEAVTAAHTDRTGPTSDTQPAGGYGLGWWVNDADRRVSNNGAYGTHAWLDLEAGYGALLVLERSFQIGREVAEQLYGPVDDAMTGQ